MRIHENRALFVRAQQNAQRRKLDELITRCSTHIAERLLASRQIQFPMTSESIERNFPKSKNPPGECKPLSATYQSFEVTDPKEALQQIEDAVALFPNTEIYLSLGDMGGMSFGEERFVHLALPMFVARPSHWSGLWPELFDLGGHCMSAVAEDGTFGVLVDCSSGWDGCGNVFEIRRWNDSQAANNP